MRRIAFAGFEASSIMPQTKAAKLHRWLLIVGTFVTMILGIWAYRVVAWYTVGNPASLKAKQVFILNPANQPAILQACQAMLATPASYPQPSGEPFPKGMPPAVASLGATSVTIYPDGVLIMFDRNFGLWAVPAKATAPNLPIPTARPLIAGLWYLAYPGN
jgi:hypothetical protein